MIVLLDACVLYPASLRDLLLEFALQARDHDLFYIRWTERIQEEWINKLLERRKDLTRDKLDRTKSLMYSAFEDYEVLVTRKELIDDYQRIGLPKLVTRLKRNSYN